MSSLISVAKIGVREVGCGVVDEFYFNFCPIKENFYIEKCKSIENS